MASCLIRSACSRVSELTCWALADASSTILCACASVSTIFLTASIPDKLRGSPEKSYCSFRRNREWAYKTVGSNSPINTVNIEGRELILRLLLGNLLHQAYTNDGRVPVFAGGQTRPGLACPPKADRIRRRAADAARSNPKKKSHNGWVRWVQLP